MPNISTTMSKMYFVVILCLLWGCDSKKQNIRTVTWNGSRHTLSDTLINGVDTQYVDNQLYLIHQVLISDTGCTIIKRNEHNSQIGIFKLGITDRLKKTIFELAIDTSIAELKSFKDLEYTETQLYCGPNYFISIDGTDFRKEINYIPTEVNKSLNKLHQIFSQILKTPNIDKKMKVDTLKLNSSIFEKVKGFNPSPPITSIINFPVNLRTNGN